MKLFLLSVSYLITVESGQVIANLPWPDPELTRTGQITYRHVITCNSRDYSPKTPLTTAIHAKDTSRDSSRLGDMQGLICCGLSSNWFRLSWVFTLAEDSQRCQPPFFRRVAVRPQPQHQLLFSRLEFPHNHQLDRCLSF